MKNNLVKIGTFVIFGFLVAVPAQADMVEIKGQGIKNGTIVSQDGKETVIKDAYGNVTRIANKDVLYIMHEDSSSETPQAQSGSVTKKGGFWDNFKEGFDQGVKDTNQKMNPQQNDNSKNLAGRLDAGERAARMQGQMDAAYNSSDVTRGQREVLARMTGRAVGDAQPPKDNWKSSWSSSSGASNPSSSKSKNSSSDSFAGSSDFHSLNKDGKESSFHSL